MIYPASPGRGEEIFKNNILLNFVHVNMAARRPGFVKVGAMLSHARASLASDVPFNVMLEALKAEKSFAAAFGDVLAAHCQVQVSTSREGADWRIMDGPDTLATLFRGDDALWIRVILPPPISELLRAHDICRAADMKIQLATHSASVRCSYALCAPCYEPNFSLQLAVLPVVLELVLRMVVQAQLPLR